MVFIIFPAGHVCVLYGWCTEVLASYNDEDIYLSDCILPMYRCVQVCTVCTVCTGVYSVYSVYRCVQVWMCLLYCITEVLASYNDDNIYLSDCILPMYRCVQVCTGVNVFTVLYYRGVGVIQWWRHLPVWLYSTHVQVCTGVYRCVQVCTGVNVFTVLYYRGVGVIQRWRLLPVWLHSSWVQVFNLPASLHGTQKQRDRCVVEMIIAWVSAFTKRRSTQLDIVSPQHQLVVSILIYWRLLLMHNNDYNGALSVGWLVG